MNVWCVSIFLSKKTTFHCHCYSTKESHLVLCLFPEPPSRSPTALRAAHLAIRPTPFPLKVCNSLRYCQQCWTLSPPPKKKDVVNNTTNNQQATTNKQQPTTDWSLNFNNLYTNFVSSHPKLQVLAHLTTTEILLVSRITELLRFGKDSTKSFTSENGEDEGNILYTVIQKYLWLMNKSCL